MTPGTLTARAFAICLMSLVAHGAAHAGNDAVSGQDSGTAASSGKPNTADAKNQISLSNFTFSPKILTVSKGATVKWTNNDDTIHRIMITDLKIKSEALDTDQSFSYKFDTAGTYDYFCTLHPMMTGVVIVK